MAAKKRYQTGVLLGQIELTEKQNEFVKIMTKENTKVVFLSGPAGTSKTFLSVYAALSLYNENQKRKILYLRTIIESASKSIGFLKGDLAAKLDPYLQPLEDKIEELLNPQEKDVLLKENVISGEPINFIRGQDWKGKIVIADEMQNATVKELLTIMTRINSDTKLFICGDTMQKDIRNSGFDILFQMFNDQASIDHGIHALEFDSSDIMRGPVVSFIIDKVEKVINEF